MQYQDFVYPGFQHGQYDMEWVVHCQDFVYPGLHRGTGMIARSSTFCPHPGRVIRDLFRLLDAVYGIVQKH